MGLFLERGPADRPLTDLQTEPVLSERPYSLVYLLIVYLCHLERHLQGGRRICLVLASPPAPSVELGI